MKKDYAIARMGGIAPLSELLNITSAAVSQWKEDVPELRVFQLRALRPRLFARQAKKKYQQPSRQRRKSSKAAPPPKIDVVDRTPSPRRRSSDPASEPTPPTSQ